MTAAPIFTPGASVPVRGCITTNAWVGPRSARARLSRHIASVTRPA
jgi:hypothetical protein